MGTIESFFFAIVGIFIFISLIRGFLKEAGLTTVMVVWLFAMDQLIPRLEGLIAGDNTFLVNLGVTSLPETHNTPLWVLFTFATIGVVFIAYQGETLAFDGSEPIGLPGGLFRLMIGTINGYLVAGTIWWILNRYDYPIREAAGLINAQPDKLLTPLGDEIANIAGLLPPDLLGQGADTADTLGVLPLLVITMVFLRIVR